MKDTSDARPLSLPFAHLRQVEADLCKHAKCTTKPQQKPGRWAVCVGMGMTRDGRARAQVNHLSFGPFLSERAWMVLPPHIAAAVGTLDDHAFTSDQHIPTTHEHYVKVGAHHTTQYCLLWEKRSSWLRRACGHEAS
jgi:hypothetical protein